MASKEKLTPEQIAARAVARREKVDVKVVAIERSGRQHPSLDFMFHAPSKCGPGQHASQTQNPKP